MVEEAARAERLMLATFGNMVFIYLAVYLLLLGIDHHVSYWLVAGLYTLTYFVTLVPISINGLGVQELSMTFLMPEEINRILTDSISDLLLTTSQDSDANLAAEGVAPERIRFVGNVMIDSLFYNLEKAKQLNVRESLGLEPSEYAVLTLHRPSNVDDPVVFGGLIDALRDISTRIPINFPVHPRTRANIEKFWFAERIADSRIKLIDPLGYLDFMNLYSGSRLVLTDSGGLQEETTALGIPCLTLRENTERPITIELGTNVLVGTDPEKIRTAAAGILDRDSTIDSKIPPLWDGRAAERICDALTHF